MKWNSLIRSLLLVRLGQELGTDSRLARLVHDVIEAISFLPAGFFLLTILTPTLSSLRTY